MVRLQGLNNAGEEMSSAYVSHEPVVLDPGGPSLTRQEFVEECDINAIMSRYETTGVISHLNANGVPQYLDIVDTPPLMEALSIISEAQAAFMRLPAKVRAQFENDAMKFIEFAQDGANSAQMREWGLAEPLPQEPPPQKVEVVNPPGAAPPAAQA